MILRLINFIYVLAKVDHLFISKKVIFAEAKTSFVFFCKIVEFFFFFFFLIERIIKMFASIS